MITSKPTVSAPISPGRLPGPLQSKLLAGLPGVLCMAVLALLAIELGALPGFRDRGLSALTLAIVFGMVAGNTLSARFTQVCDSGVTFSKQRLLRAGVVLYGLRLTFQDIAHVGFTGIATDALVLSSTFALSWWAGTRLFGLDRQTAMLIGAGSAICGAAAVMATEPVLRARAEQVTVAVSTVVVFGTLAIFLYPALYHLNARHALLPMSPAAYGIFAGSTIHEVAQVVAAGRAVSAAAADTAVITKMVRVMMLAPFLVLLSAYLARRPAAAQPAAAVERATAGQIVLPWFAVGFVAVAGVNSLVRLPPALVGATLDADTFLLAMAMAALGMSTHSSALRRAGIRPLALAALLFAWLLMGGLAINAGVAALFG